MPQKKPDDTRRLLKVFGVAVTDFEDESRELLERIRALDGRPDDELVAALRDMLELVTESSEKWQAVTEHLFGMQRRALSEVVAALPGGKD